MKQTIANSSFNNPKKWFGSRFQARRIEIDLEMYCPAILLVYALQRSWAASSKKWLQQNMRFLLWLSVCCFCWLLWCLFHWYIDIHTFQLHQIESSRKIAGAIPFTLSSNNSRCFGIVCFGKPKTWLSNKILIKLLNEQLKHETRQFLWVVCCSLEVH